MAISPLHPQRVGHHPSISARRVEIRPAVRRDLPWVMEIFNAAVHAPSTNLELVPWDSPRVEQWFAGFASDDRVLVAQLDGEVIGFASFGEFRRKSGYQQTKECSVYVSAHVQKMGVATRLYRALIRAAQQAGCRGLIAVIVGGNEASAALHRKFGFRHSGILYEAGYKHARWHDAHIYQLRLASGEPELPPCA